MKNIIHLGLLTLLFFLVACHSENTDQDATLPISDEMPNDFDFIVKFGITKKNEINTYENTITKDLIANGTVTTNLILTDDEMAMIYKKMKEVNITETKQYVPKSGCSMEPYSEDEWMITLNGEEIKHNISGTYCEKTDDAKEMIELRDYVHSFVESKEVYKSLPNAEGGYE